LLTAHGIAYVNHSTYPGAHVRSMVREMMLYHVRKETGTARRIRNARALLEFLLQAATTSGLKPASPADDQDGFYAKALQWEAENIRSAPDAHFRHDSLAEVNDPGYFADFVHAAEQCGLQYLADSYYYMMQTNSFSPEVCRQIDQFTHNVVEREQYIDFIRNRVFRHTLLCRDNVRLNHHLTADRVPQFHVASRLEPASRNLSFADETAVPFCHPDGPQVNVGNPFLKAAFLLLAEHWPQFIPFEELASRAAQRLASKTGGSLQLTDVSRETQLLAEGLLGCIQRGLVQFSVCPPRFELQPTERPKVSPLARLQAEGGEWVTNRRHEGVKLNPLRKLLLPKLDGRHSRDQLLQMLVDLARAGTLQIDENGGAITDNDRVRAILSEKLDATLGELARLALLIQ
jgi:methyltransferase-like protein